MKRRKHSLTEIADKLVKADQLVAEGKLQVEVARALGVSIMTYHRWRKAQRSQTKGSAGTVSVGNNSSGFTSSPGGDQSIKQLSLENARLRNLFTDMVLEKIEAGSVSVGNNSSGFTSSPGGDQSIEQLRLENARLRNLFTDMVLEKIELEDELRALKLQRKNRSLRFSAPG